MAEQTITIVSLVHDIAQRKSYVNFAWADDPSKRLGLEVPYGTSLDKIEKAARTAVDALSSELAGALIVHP